MKTYYLLTKPGIIMGNLMTTASGFLLASRGDVNFGLFLWVLLGLGCVIASACVCNNYIDRESDKKMARTRNRPLARKAISEKRALLFAAILGILGFFTLTLYTNNLAAAIAAIAFIVYVVLYSFWKHRSSFATLVGSISGAIPPVVGYTAVSGRLDAGAVLLFLIMVLWQMPHFFSIAMYRFADYRAASIPVLPIQKGLHATKVQMLLYIIAFMIATYLLLFFGYAGYAYLVVAALLGLSWLGLCILGFRAPSDERWARSMFRLSLLVITGLSIMISLDCCCG